jgi:hypothetical protein
MGGLIFGGAYSRRFTVVDRLFIYRLTEKLRDKQSFLWQVHDVHLDVSFNSSITSELHIYLEQELQSACYEKR